MSIHVFRLLGTLHGLFGLFMLSMLSVAYSQGLFGNIATGRAALKIVGTVLGIALLLACAWASWKNTAWAAPLAWMALAVFVVSAAGDEVFEYGVRGFANLMPTFYVGVMIRATAAAAMTFLTIKL